MLNSELTLKFMIVNRGYGSINLLMMI
ncbi:hypothetical protein SKA34_04665 [Photobacterium sp. SKA34]|nr:hypothetical protein SKA34_04665 [Photobacterium sp. SKA34]